MADKLRIEKLGGLAGFGLSASHIRSEGTSLLSALSPTDRAIMESLFEGHRPAAAAGGIDAFRYRITRETPHGPQTIEVHGDDLPEMVKRSVTDRLD